ncbi:c-5 sterol desaturase [Aspergillus melleus]|uniref:C-5 sterol desaturase n=1 Tax=Aspergillus melleus TaxID=138277 RepID=A0ACC3B946_9EURO|nr:c-5 sterol desaturase [Aspergillus melleus]
MPDEASGVEPALNVLDTWVFDRFYATVLPRPTPKLFEHLCPSNGTEWNNLNQNINRYVEITMSEWAV